jgi:peptidoglycan/xylan/chitin deacetylase (PgdA/CDA1 family)
LRILAKHEVRATFFVPGWIAHRYPDTVRAIVGAGHEIGHHGYLHEHVDVVDEATELSYLDRGSEALEEVAGVRPVGYRAPGAELNYRSPGLLARRGFRYDSTLMDADTPYVIDLPDEARLVEIPIQWALDDWEQYAFVPGYEGSGVIESPSKALEMWTLELEAMRDEGGCFVLVNHPLLSGRPSRARTLEQLIERAVSFGDVWVTTLGQIAEHVLSLELPGRQLSAPPVDRHRSPLTAS